jgi:sucrose-phosphate synthase
MTTESNARQHGLYLLLISVHGLIRGHDLELGRDADTGGQVTYVVELARALGELADVDRVDLVTRLVEDENVDENYARPVEPLSSHARIVRIAAGPPRYIAKEQLWDHLDTLTDNLIDFLRAQDRMPDLIHSHYADAGYVGSGIASMTGIPLVHTGHSLGRVKRRRLLAAGLDAAKIERRYHMRTRINAEERTLATAERVIASTRQEIREQYGLYDHYRSDAMEVIPPGTDLERFHPPEGNLESRPIDDEIRRFLNDPDRPLVFTLCRPDPRKNLAGLVTAFGESDVLRERANLLVVAGNRDDIDDLESGSREVLTELLLLIDRFDLYGRVACPKHHTADDVPHLYRLAAASGGVFVNPALTEPFGLTLIEAAASGLPVVATDDGGPRDIIANCGNGALVDPLDTEAIARAIIDVLDDRETWRQRARHGLAGVRRHYTWKAHAESYLELIGPIVDRTARPLPAPRSRRPMLHHERALVSDLDLSLVGDDEALSELIGLLQNHRHDTTFCVATGRRLDSALRLMKQHGIPEPDVLISSGGTSIHYAPRLTEDESWTEHIDHLWKPQLVRRILDTVPGLGLQPKVEQSRFKISYYIDTAIAPSIERIHSLLYQAELSVNIIHSFGQYLDIVPIRASKGLALRYVAARWEIPLERVLVAGGSGADEDMMRGNPMAVVVANRHHEELSSLVNMERIHFARGAHARGILEAIEHYGFFAESPAPERATGSQ